MVKASPLPFGAELAGIVVPGPERKFSEWPRNVRDVWHGVHDRRIAKDLRFYHLIGMGVCIACLIPDALAGLLELGGALRLGLVVPFYVISILLLRTQKRAVAVSAAILPIVLFAWVATYLGMKAGPAHQDNYVISASVFVSISILLLPLRFRSTALLALLCCFAIALTIAVASSGLAEHANLLIFSSLCCAVPLLIKRRNDALKDANFLLTLQSRQAQDDLLCANRVLEELSKHDPLTGLLNRRGFEKKFQAAFVAAQGSGASTALLLMDLDHFKRFNDTYGHSAGDKCLIGVADILRDRAERHNGLAGRHGGEELIAAFTVFDKAEATGIAEAIRQDIADNRLEIGRGTHCSVTVSIGGTFCTSSETALDRYIADADRALYGAKENGRNRVVFYRPGDRRSEWDGTEAMERIAS